MVRWPNRGTRNLSTAIRRISIEYKWQNFVSGAGVHISCHAAWQEWTSRTVSGATRNHPTFATKRATLIFPPPWICCEERVRTVSRTVCAETCVRQILRDYRPHGWGPALKYVRAQEIWRAFELHIFVRMSEYNYQKAIDRKASPTMGWQQLRFFTRKTLWNSSSNEILLN